MPWRFGHPSPCNFFWQQVFFNFSLAIFFRINKKICILCLHLLHIAVGTRAADMILIIDNCNIDWTSMINMHFSIHWSFLKIYSMDMFKHIFLASFHSFTSKLNFPSYFSTCLRTFFRHKMEKKWSKISQNLYLAPHAIYTCP